jgi:prepilin-type N-terminal cleavage/methylation domain-containing protein
MQKRKTIFKKDFTIAPNYLVRGFTLIETLVAITLLLIGTAATVLLFSKMMQNKAYSLEMGRSSFVVSRSIGDLTQYLRRTRQSDAGAYPIVSADDNNLVIYSDYNKDDKTERLHIYLSNNKIYMGIRNPNATFPVTYSSGDATTIQLADHIVNTSDDPIFSYYNKDYPADTENNPVDTPANVSEIRLIKIFLKININPNRAPDNIQQETFVELRNLNDYDRIH